MTRYAVLDVPGGALVIGAAYWDGVTAWVYSGQAVVVPAGLAPYVAQGWSWDGVVFRPPVPSVLPPLDEYKVAGCLMVDVETARRFTLGFVFDGVLMSSSPIAQQTADAAVKASELLALTYPIRWSSLDNSTFVTLDNALDVVALFVAGAGYVQPTKQAGADAKISAMAATTHAEVDDAVYSYLES
jgi:hypothetical protein